jgi:N-acetylmuramoyl-L-alanine amidase
MMRRALFLFFTFFISTILLSFTRKDTPLPKATVRTLVIDPGHGGIDPGARGTFSNEADVSLAVSLKFGKALEKDFPDLKIIYTRTTDIMPGNKRTKDEGLRYRADLANESGGDLFIAIHCNSAGRKAGGWYERVVVSRTPKTRYVKRKGKKVKQTYYVNKYQNVWRENLVRGTETYIWAVSKNDAKVSSINKNDHMEDYGEIDSTSTLTLPDPSDPAEKARMLIYAQHYFRKSHELADLVEKEFVSTGRTSRGVKQRNDKGIWVLQATGMPSILVEIGFISNKEEEEYINSDAGQEEIVNNLVNAFRAYKEKIESKSISTSP